MSSKNGRDYCPRLPNAATMKNPQNYTYGGLFILILGLGSDAGSMIPAWFKIGSGLFFIVYGMYLHYKTENRFRFDASDFNIKRSALSSKVYLVMGVLLVKANNFSTFIDDTMHLNSTLTLLGFAFLAYGLNLHFKEKKDKRESGNIE